MVSVHQDDSKNAAFIQMNPSVRRHLDVNGGDLIYVDVDASNPGKAKLEGDIEDLPVRFLNNF